MRIYLISWQRCCDHILSAGFVTTKADAVLLVKRHMLESVLEDASQFTIKLKGDIVLVTEVDGGYVHTYHIQTVEKLQ